ncbi:TetR/AcrR family transcriptional regulator [Nocardia stercoris]|uniref:TetR/AcrR family transcriptional regulator n=1 Tax=Nocardia stercoris TaxID=2483361 RepID=A0A3M2LE97_9NOCA|nr:TetR/AcrR family transcriptional regulator [Nocardia stercoris]RMI35376.1 TetR/AcrR family transcriptional regulator [Nocardia stercoris]
MTPDTPPDDRLAAARPSAEHPADGLPLLTPPNSLPLETIGPDGPLPTLGHAADPCERGDAARNRRLLLDAAQALVRELGADAVTMDAVAKRAGVGKGTVFRRFGSRAGLMLSLLDHSDRQLQAAYMFGPPPLGPDAPPVDRLIAYGRARLADVEVEGELRRAADLPGRYTVPPYHVAKTHVSLLLRQAGATGDIGLLADTLLGTLDAALVLHQIQVLGYSPAQIGNHWEHLVRTVTRPS